jgi:hypothetical protein
MKKNISLLLLVLAILTIPILQSCNKYEDGPMVSLRPRAERVANRWKVENYKIDGADYTSIVSDYTEQFSKDQAYSYTWGSISGAGTWSFQNNDEEIKLSGSDDHSSRTLFITKLEEKAFWYYYMEDNKKNEVHLIPN